MQRTMDVAQQISLLEGFDQVADRPGFERLDACVLSSVKAVMKMIGI
jgi:hypothetical protein